MTVGKSEECRQCQPQLQQLVEPLAMSCQAGDAGLVFLHCLEQLPEKLRNPEPQAWSGTYMGVQHHHCTAGQTWLSGYS